MHSITRVLLASAWSLGLCLDPVMAQTGSSTPSGPASGTQRHEEPAKVPAAAPRTPVQKTGAAGDQKADRKPATTAAPKTPVVTPRRPSHPQKPGTTVPPAKPAPAPSPAPSAPAPPAASGEVKAPAAADKTADQDKAEAAKLPRFAALRSDDVNMRAGPGTRYRIEWVYKRRDLPVEIEREFDVWRWVRDPDGIQGWVHQATLMGRRNFIVRNADAVLRSEPAESAIAVAELKVGVIGRIRSCEATSAWCHVQAGSYRGYLRRDQFWGVLPGEAISP